MWRSSPLKDSNQVSRLASSLSTSRSVMRSGCELTCIALVFEQLTQLRGATSCHAVAAC